MIAPKRWAILIPADTAALPMWEVWGFRRNYSAARSVADRYVGITVPILIETGLRKGMRVSRGAAMGLPYPGAFRRREIRHGFDLRTEWIHAAGLACMMHLREGVEHPRCKYLRDNPGEGYRCAAFAAEVPGGEFSSLRVTADGLPVRRLQCLRAEVWASCPA